MQTKKFKSKILNFLVEIHWYCNENTMISIKKIWVFLFLFFFFFSWKIKKKVGQIFLAHLKTH